MKTALLIQPLLACAMIPFAMAGGGDSSQQTTSKVCQGAGDIQSATFEAWHQPFLVLNLKGGVTTHIFYGASSDDLSIVGSKSRTTNLSDSKAVYSTTTNVTVVELSPNVYEVKGQVTGKVVNSFDQKEAPQYENLQYAGRISCRNVNLQN
jgi:hypothetical protein